MWTIKIHRLVIEEDFQKLDYPARKRIIKTIRKKLSVAPADYGEPLRGEFKNYWKMKVGDYRVVYRIIEKKILVLVIKIGIRRDEQVYKELFYRRQKIERVSEKRQKKLDRDKGV